MTEERDTVFSFPCDFPIKAFGRLDDDREQAFESTVLRLVQSHAPEVGPDDISTRESRGGRYAAVTVHINAQSQAQLDAIYADLTASDRVLMSL